MPTSTASCAALRAALAAERGVASVHGQARCSTSSSALLGLRAAGAAAARRSRAWIRLDSPGPVFFRQERVGRHGVPFRIHKFRTMARRRRADAGPQLTVGADPRITRAGALPARARKLDELPQLIDVLRGDMSLVGPRPEVPRYVALYPPALRDKVLACGPASPIRPRSSSATRPTLLARAADPEREYVEVRPAGQAARSPPTTSTSATLRSDLRRDRRAPLRAAVAPTRERAADDAAPSVWHRLDRFLARAAPAPRAAVAGWSTASSIALCWNVTYLFRLGFERWCQARPELRRLGDARRHRGLPAGVRAAATCRAACGASRASARSSG